MLEVERMMRFYRMGKGAGDDFSAKISFSRIAIEPCAGCRTQTYGDAVVAAVFSHRRRRFLLQIGGDNAERCLGSLNYMRQSKFAKFPRRLIMLIVRPRRSIHLVSSRRRSLLYFSRSPASRRLKMFVHGILCARAVTGLSEK